MLASKAGHSSFEEGLALGFDLHERWCVLRKRFVLGLILVSLTQSSLSVLSVAQTLRRLKRQPPNGAGVGFLLTDGTVMFQSNSSSDFYKLTPDNTGSYLNGTWTKLASLPSGYSPDAFAYAVLA